MNKKLKAQIAYIEKHAGEPTPELLKYHEAMLAQFQHERLIHLIVTMFFALFMVLFFILFFILGISLEQSAWSNVILCGVGAIDGILLIVTLFYVRHYYQLENGVQRLEELTKKLHKI